MSRALEALYLTAAVAPFEALLGLAYGSVGPLIAYNILLTAVPLLVAGYLAYRTILPRASAVLAFLGLAKAYALMASLPPEVSGLLDSGIVVALASLPMLPGGGGLAKAGGAASILGSLLVLSRVPSLVAAGLLVWGLSLVLAGFSFPENVGRD